MYVPAKDERGRIINSHLLTKKFPPQIIAPSMNASTAAVWKCPYIVWVPECAVKIIHCVIEGCSCKPKVHGYKDRFVEDIEHRTKILYIQYKCSARRKKGRSFSTLDAEWLSRCPVNIQDQLQYVLTYKYGMCLLHKCLKCMA